MKTAKQMTLGSLFDGIGGFPLASIYAGMEPVWASEIEPFPIRVTEKKLPGMKHYGDIHRLSGAELEPVDVVTFGSPCQDLSIAGKRRGLEGARSGLFYQAVRIIQEMRDATNGQYPRWAVWENVPGALSSHNGEDFRQVLESLIHVKDTFRPMMNTQVDQEKAASLMARDHKDPIAVSMPAYALDRACFNAGENAQYRMNVSEEVAPTLVAEGPSAVADMDGMYIVRRLTPLECCRLQGFPDGWTENLGSDEPTEQEIARWFGVFEDWHRFNGRNTGPSRNRIVKWLKEPRTDSAEYKAYGNSIAVPCAFFVLAGVMWAEEQEGGD